MRSTRHLKRFAAALMSVSILGGIAVLPDAHGSISDQIASKQTAAQQLQTDISADNASIAATSSGVASARQQLSAIETKLAGRLSELKSVQTQLMTARDDLGRLEARLQKSSSALALNLRTQYEQGTPNLMTVILNAHGFSQLLDQVNFQERISKQDASIVGTTRSARAKVLGEANRLGSLESRDRSLTDQILSQRNQEAALESTLYSKEIAETDSRDGARSKLAGVQSQLAALKQKQEAIVIAAERRVQESEDQQAEQVNESAGNGLPIDTSGMVQAPADAPQAVKLMIAAGNAIATLPYIWGGGHGSFISPGYDCSGSVSYVLNAAGLLSAPETSDMFMSYGDPGPGQWVTIWATDGHVWMTIAGWRFDTVALAEDGSRWSQGGGEFAGFVQRHRLGCRPPLPMAPSADSTFGRNRRILAATAAGVARGAVTRRQQFRYQYLREIWTASKRFGAAGVHNVEIADIPLLWPAVVTGYVDDHQRVLIAALAAGLGAGSCFEIGTSLGRTTWTLAHHLPDLRVWTLDMPLDRQAETTALPLGEDDRSYFRPVTACGEAFADTPEAERITQLWGDSATFDFSPYAGQADLVYVDGAHTSEYVANDTRAALEMLSPRGAIIWDDYATSPGVYEYFSRHAGDFDRPIHHVIGTRMAIYSRQDFVNRRPAQYPFSAD